MNSFTNNKSEATNALITRHNNFDFFNQQSLSAIFVLTKFAAIVSWCLIEKQSLRQKLEELYA